MEREKAMDYRSKTYSNPIRDAAAPPGRLKPQQQQQAGDGERAKVSRSTSTLSKVATSEEKKKVDVRRKGENVFTCCLFVCLFVCLLFICVFNFFASFLGFGS